MDFNSDGKVDSSDFWLLVRQFFGLALISAAVFWFLGDPTQHEFLEDVFGSWPPFSASDGNWGFHDGDAMSRPQQAAFDRSKTDTSRYLWIFAPLNGNAACVSRLLGEPCRHWWLVQLAVAGAGAAMVLRGLAAVHAKEVRTQRVPGLLGLFGYRREVLVDEYREEVASVRSPARGLAGFLGFQDVRHHVFRRAVMTRRDPHAAQLGMCVIAAMAAWCGVDAVLGLSWQLAGVSLALGAACYGLATADLWKNVKWVR